MNYRVTYHRDWDRQLRRLPERVAARARERAASLAENPRPQGYRQLHPRTRGYRIKIFRDWRLVYQINESTRQVSVRGVYSRGSVRY